MTPDLLLDTCAMIWIGTDAPLRDDAVRAIDESADLGLAVQVSPITAWEIGMLVSKGRLKLPNQPGSWFNRICANTNVDLSAMPIELMIQASFL
ncbi:MAG: type II toxin-antitoxin system VapC family toxin, partial [Alphaproteobacteria bacterium]|nr:type II toxin-antitoxin system VapC family toxin [Alphaproteobacteria bacterium]